MTTAIVITGIGATSPAGFGSQALWDALVEKRACLTPVDPPVPKGTGRLCGAIDGIDAFLDDRRWRRAAGISKYSIAAIRLALADAGLDAAAWESRETGLVTAVTHGAIRFTREFHEAVIKEGPAAASPMLFSDSVLNAPAGNASIAFNVRGPAHTVSGDLGAGTLAVSTALKSIRHGGVKVCLAGGAEELDPVVRGVYASLGLLAPKRGSVSIEAMRPFSKEANGFIPGEGACFIVLEEKDSAIERGARIYAEVLYAKTPLAAARELNTDDWGGTIVFSGANGTSVDAIEEAALGRLFNNIQTRPDICCIKPLVGEAFAASGMMQAAAAAMAIYKGATPPSNIEGAINGLAWARRTDAAQARRIKTAIASAAGFDDGGGLVVLKAVSD
ncbi:MAG: hypothetical protein HZB85_05165 [Deltaproteobacteria bacterium]|nr:hypothetical protein [Deltaproteobacteria bacterium]